LDRPGGQSGTEISNFARLAQVLYQFLAMSAIRTPKRIIPFPQTFWDRGAFWLRYFGFTAELIYIDAIARGGMTSYGDLMAYWGSPRSPE
jgi:hypothetical protein